MRRVVAAVLLAVLGCGDATAPLPQGATEFTPPSQYAFWWSMTEECSGLTGDMSAIRWYAVPYTAALGKDVDGLYYTTSHRIILLADSISSGQVVRHEMLHALGAEPGHPAKYFQDRCQGAVNCSSACISDGGARPPVDSTGPIVSPGQLDLTAFTNPDTPTAGDSSWLALTIQVRNPHPYPVRVALTEVFGTPVSETFGLITTSCPASVIYQPPVYDWIHGNRIVLAAGEVRRRVFDIGNWSCRRRINAYFNDMTIMNRVVSPIGPASRTKNAP